MKKLLLLVLVACAAVGSAQGLRRSERVSGSRLQCPVASAAKVQEPCVRTITTNGVEWAYKVVDGGVVLETRKRERIKGALVVPDTIAGMSVRIIGEDAFFDCRGLVSVTIPSSVTNIGKRAFLKCGGLASVTIPSGVTSVGEGAFGGCCGLTAISVGAGNRVYCSVDGVLYNKAMTNLIRWPEGKKGAVTIPEGVTSIEGRAFSGCNGLTSVAIPSTVTSIGARAFYDCRGLTSVTIPSSVTRIGVCAFCDCSGLTSVTISPGGVTSVGAYVFCGCSGLTSVTIPSSVTSIGYKAFSGCSGLTSVTIPPSMTSIDNAAFSGCSGLTSVIIPPSVTSIGYEAFCGCRGLTSVTIPSSVTSIDKEAFYGCSGLTSVTIPSSVTRIGYGAFRGCSGLTSVTIPSSVTSIDNEAFRGCSGLTSILVEAGNADYCSVDGVLYDKEMRHLILCPEGKKGAATIPSSVTSIDTEAFCGCSGLTSILVEAGSADYCSVDGVLYDKEMMHLIRWPEGKKGVMTTPESVTSIGVRAFCGCSGLASVTIPAGVTNIGYSAFRGCGGLTSATIPTSLTNVAMRMQWKRKTDSVMRLEDAVESVFGRGGTLLPLTNGMMTVVFEKSKAIKNPGVRGGGSLGVSPGSRRLQRQREEQSAAVKQQEEQKAKDAERQVLTEEKKKRRKAEMDEQRRLLLAIQEELKRVREAKARAAAEGAKK